MHACIVNLTGAKMMKKHRKKEFRLASWKTIMYRLMGIGIFVVLVFIVGTIFKLVLRIRT